MDAQQIYEKLWASYQRTGKIGPVKPKSDTHAKVVAHAAALSIFNRQKGKQYV